MEFKNLFKSTFKGLFRGIILTVILLILLAIFMSFKEISSKALNIVLTIIICVSILYGSIVATIKNGKNGWLVGIIIGGAYFLIILIFTNVLLRNNLGFGTLTFVKLLMFMTVGMLSGMLAINM